MGKITVVPVQKSGQYEAPTPAPKPMQRPLPSPFAPQSSGVMDKNVSLNLRTLLSVLVFVVLISGSFLLGRYVFPAGESNLGASAAAVVDTAPVAELEAPKEAEAPAPEPAAEEPAPSEPTPTETAPAEPTTPPSTEVITSYSNVKLTFTKVPTYTWYEEDAYGKITTIWYTVVNGENGIIKPTKFRLKVEGYDSETDVKFVDVPGADKEIDAGETATHGVDKLISYSSTVTDPSNINLQMDLLDENNKIIATVSQEFNLK